MTYQPSPNASAPPAGALASPTKAGGGRAQSVTSRSGKRSETAIKAFLPTNPLQKATFEVVYILSKDTDLPERLTWLFAVLEDAQLFVFAFNAGIHRQMPAEVETILDVFGTPNDPAGFTVMNACCIALVFLSILLTAVAVALANVNRVPIWLLRILRYLFAVMINVLNVPLTTVLLMGLHCPTVQGNARPAWCSPGIDVASIVLNSLAIISFLPMLWVSAVMFIDANPASKSPMAKPESQLDLHGVFVRLTLVGLKVFLTGGGHFGSEVLIYLLLAAAGLTYLTHQLITTHPYFDARMGMLRSGLHCGATSAIIASLILYLTVGVNSGNWWYLLIPASIVGIVVGACLSHFCLKRVLHGTLRMHRQLKQGTADKLASDLSAYLTPIAIAQRVKLRNTASPMGAAGGLLKLGKAPPGGSKSAGIRSGVGAGRPDASGRGNMTEWSSAGSLPTNTDNADTSVVDGGGKKTQSLQGKLETGASTDTLNAFMEKRQEVRKHVFDSPRVVEICLRVLRVNPSPRQRLIALQLLEQGLSEFPRDPQLLLMASAYFQSFFGDDGERSAAQVMQVLQSGKVPNPPLHIRFKIYCNERSSRELGRHVLDSATISILLREVRKYHLLSMCMTRDSWEAIRTSAPEGTLSDIISKLAKHRSMAEGCYQRLLSKNSKDKNLLRLYSQFAHFVLADPDLAAEVLEHAEEVEIAETERQTMMATANNAATVVMIDQQTQRLKDDAYAAFNSTNLPQQSAAPKQDSHTFSPDMYAVKNAPVLAPPTEDDPDSFFGKPIPASSPEIRGTSLFEPAKVASASGSSTSIDVSRPSLDADVSGQVKFIGRAPSKDSIGRRPSSQPRSRRGSMFKNMIRKASQSSAQADVDSDPDIEVPPMSIPLRNGSAKIANLGNGSQTSGTSLSRTARKKLAARRQMSERVASPLVRTWLLTGFIVVFLASVVYGYWNINRLFLATQDFLTKEYDSARLARVQARTAATAVRRMVHGNEIGSRQVWQEAFVSAQEAVKDLTAVHIPTLASFLQSDTLTIRPKPQRMFIQRLSTNQTFIDLYPIDVTALDVVERVAQLTNLALGMAFGQLTQAVYKTFPEFNWYTENTAQVFDLLKDINYSVMDGYRVALARDLATIALTAVVSLICLVGGLGLLHLFIFKLYFKNVSHVMGLLLGVQKRAASDVVTALEAEIEGFMELFSGENDDLDEDAEVRALMGNAGISSSSNNDRRGKLKRDKKHALMLVGFFSLLAALTAGMYIFAMNALSAENDLQRLLQVVEQCNTLGTTAIYTNELFSPAQAVPRHILVANLRSTVKDFDYYTRAISSDPHGLSVLVPDLTVLPRNCSLPTSCLSIKPNVTIGLTREMGEVSLFGATKRFSDITHDLINTVVECPQSTALFDIPYALNKYQLVSILGEDIRARVSHMAVTVLGIFVQRVQAASVITIVLFSGIVVVLGVGVTILVGLGLRTLQDESRALTTLPYLLPPAVLAHEGELNAFMESGGLMLKQSETPET